MLAGGNGERLRRLTTTADGVPVPKQYCALRDGPSLLRLALDRASRVSGRRRTAAVVADGHRRFWQDELRHLPAGNVVAQPRNCGTAAGVLLPLLAVLARETDPTVVLVPADHFVSDEDALEEAIRDALDRVALDPDRLVLLGIPPDDPEPAFGWIVPAVGARGLSMPVGRFVEKPPFEAAVRLRACGGLWNSFILAARGRTLLGLYEWRLPRLLATLEAALAMDREANGKGAHLASAYESLGSNDFSRDLLEGAERHLTVVRVRPCGWTDLGTPERVARSVGRLELPVTSACPV